MTLCSSRGLTYTIKHGVKDEHYEIQNIDEWHRHVGGLFLEQPGEFISIK